MKSAKPKKISRIRIIGAASGVGAQDPACEDGPVAFHGSQAWHELAHHPALDWGGTLFAPQGEAAPAGLISDLIDRLLPAAPRKS